MLVQRVENVFMEQTLNDIFGADIAHLIIQHYSVMKIQRLQRGFAG